MPTVIANDKRCVKFMYILSVGLQGNENACGINNNVINFGKVFIEGGDAC